MSPWFAKSLGDALLAGESLSRIEERFRAEYERLGRPPDMAVFVRDRAVRTKNHVVDWSPPELPLLIDR